MSAAAAAPAPIAARPTHMVTSPTALMRVIGSREGFDPMPPSQHAYFMDASQPPENRLWGWISSKTIHPGKSGKWSGFARDQRGTLTLKHAAVDLGLTLSNASTALKKLEARNRVHQDEEGRLWFGGQADEPIFAIGEEEAKESEEVFCTENLSREEVEFFQSLPENERKYKLTHYRKALEYGQQIETDAIAAGRMQKRKYLDGVLSKLGHQRKEPRGRPKAERPLIVELAVRVEPDQFFVQKTSSPSVQNPKGDSVQPENEGVQKTHPYRADEQISQRVSGADAPAETLASAPPPPAPLTENPLPVEEEPKADPNPVVAAVEYRFGRKLDPAMRAKYADLAPSHGIPAWSVCRFIAELCEQKEKSGYKIYNPGALLKFVLDDLPGWRAQKRNAAAIESDRKYEAGDQSAHVNGSIDPEAEAIRAKALAMAQGEVDS